MQVDLFIIGLLTIFVSRKYDRISSHMSSSIGKAQSLRSVLRRQIRVLQQRNVKNVGYDNHVPTQTKVPMYFS